MNIRTLASALFALALLAQAPLAAAQATVTVEDGKVVVDPPALSRSANPESMTWTLQTAGYTFAGSGITFGSAGAGQCKVASDRRSVTCRIASVPAGGLSYQVNLAPGNGSAPPAVSPKIWMVND